MAEMTSDEYWAEVRSIAETVLEEVLGECKSDGGEDEDSIRERLEERLWETIDGHEWVIYTAYNYDVLRHSPNDSYAIENWGADGVVDDTGLKTGSLAFGALYADVSERLWTQFEETVGE